MRVAAPTCAPPPSMPMFSRLYMVNSFLIVRPTVPHVVKEISIVRAVLLS